MTTPMQRLLDAGLMLQADEGQLHVVPLESITPEFRRLILDNALELHAATRRADQEIQDLLARISGPRGTRGG